jgi:hypothetical protein
MHGTHVELKNCAAEFEFLQPEDEHDSPMFRVTFFDKGLDQYCCVTIKSPTYLILDDGKGNGDETFWFPGVEPESEDG